MSTGQTICFIILLLLGHALVHCHLPSHASTPANKVDLYCQLAESCVHDIIPICGKQGEKTRTFLDLCDMLEYTCDRNEIYTHIDDIKDCPRITTPKP